MRKIIVALYCKKKDTIRGPEVIHRWGRIINGPRHFEAGHGAGLFIRLSIHRAETVTHSEVIGRAKAISSFIGSQLHIGHHGAWWVGLMVVPIFFEIIPEWRHAKVPLKHIVDTD